MNDIENKADIKLFVDQFYSKVQADDLIGPVFNNKIGNGNWPKHLERMYSFWNSVLFGAADYRGNPFLHHISLGIEKDHFDRWINLFTSTINDRFEGAKASEAIDRANKMRLMFELKLNHLKKNKNIHPII